MPISIDLRRKVEEATRLIDAGRESYGSLAKRFGLGKATIYRVHFARLTAEVEGRKRELVDLERRTRELRVNFEGLENKYREKRAGLEEDYRKRRMELEERIEKLRQDAVAQPEGSQPPQSPSGHPPHAGTPIIHPHPSFSPLW